MPVRIITGAQWGDEGKGKLTDIYAERADVVGRFQGGNNAGHTLVVLDEDGEAHKTVLHLVPSGVLWPEKKCVIGAGVVVDPKALLAELAQLELDGIDVSHERIRVASNAHAILPYHKELDLAREAALGSKKIGTTGRGIGPCYEDRAARRGITMQELVDPDVLKTKLESALPEKNHMLAFFQHAGLDLQAVQEEYVELGRKLRPYVGGARQCVQEALAEDKEILLEGAQGAMLDISHGTYPFVTSSHTISGAACTSLGIGPKHITSVLGVTKAYTTRVGAGPFPTELDDELGEQLRTAGAEFGATTGRPRRCGWLDIPALRYAASINGLTELALMKLDVLTGLETIKICIGYRNGSQEIFSTLRNDGARLEGLEPHYIEIPGWKEGVRGLWRFADLPPQARSFVRRVETLAGLPVTQVSVGPERDATISLRNL